MFLLHICFNKPSFDYKAARSHTIQSKPTELLTTSTMMHCPQNHGDVFMGKVYWNRKVKPGFYIIVSYRAASCFGDVPGTLGNLL